MMEFLWCEKYRPKSINDCILPKDLSESFAKMVQGNELQNMMFTGTAGTGKTTVARALCNDLNLDYILINGSEDGNIDTLRGIIKQFASTVSLQGGYKVVILDEADYLNPQSTQPALRGFIEEFSQNCRFIMTCNFKNRIIEPLHSRCAVYDFSIPKSEKPQIATAFFKRLTNILQNESVEYDQKSLVPLIQKYFPDWRRIINECQRYSVSGKIDAGILSNMGDTKINDLISHLKNKEFNKMRKWVADNADLESTAIFRKLYDSMSEHLQPHSIPNVVIILAQYQYWDAFVSDHELNIVACMTEIMSSSEWK